MSGNIKIYNIGEKKLDLIGIQAKANRKKQLHNNKSKTHKHPKTMRFIIFF